MQELDLIGTGIAATAIAAISYLTFRTAKKENQKRVAVKAYKRDREGLPEKIKHKPMSTAELDRAKVRKNRIALIAKFGAMNVGNLAGEVFESQYQFQTMYYQIFLRAMDKDPSLDVKIFSDQVKAERWGAGLILDLRLHPKNEIKPTTMIVTSDKKVSMFARNLEGKLQDRWPGKVVHFIPENKAIRYWHTVHSAEDYALIFLARCGDKNSELQIVEERVSIVNSIIDAAKKYFEV